MSSLKESRNLKTKSFKKRRHPFFKIETIRRMKVFHFGILVVGFSVDDDFNLIQPSLIQQLRTILDQYPDDGQILKVKKAHRLIVI